MTDAPFTETHRLTLEMQREVRGDYPDTVLSDAIAAALAEIDRLNAALARTLASAET